MLSKNTRTDLLLIVLAGIVAWALVPAYMMSNAPQELGALDGEILFGVSAIFALTSSLALALLYVGLKAFRFKSEARYLVLFVLFWVTISGLIFPVSESTGMVDPGEVPTNKVNFVIVLLLSSLFVFVSATRAKRAVPVFFTVLLSTTVISLAPSTYRLFFDLGAKDITYLSNEKNILVLSFDGLPGNMVQRALDEQPGLRRDFKDFRFFANAISVAPATASSMTHEMFGSLDLKSIGKTLETARRALDRRRLLINRYQDSYTFGSYYWFNLNERTRLFGGEIRGKPFDERLEAILNLYMHVVVRVGTNRAVRWLSPVIDRVGKQFRQPLPAHVLEGRVLNHRGHKWDIPFILESKDLEDFIAQLKVGRSKISLRYMHFLHTHFPVDFDERCEYRGDDSEWYSANQNEQGLLNQTVCALNQMSSFLKKLKTLGVYDRSLVVLKSDHGEPANYFSSPPHNYRINRHELWGFNRYRPTLMVKDYNRATDRMEVVSDLVVLGDLANTLCRKADQETESCEKLSGIDLLGGNLSYNPPPFYLEVVEGPSSTYHYDTHKSIAFNRQPDFLQMLMGSPEIELSE